MAALGIFGLLQIHGFLNWVRSLMSPESYNRFFKISIITMGSLFLLAFSIGIFTGIYIY